MNRIYFSILLTAIISLFTVGKLIDQLFEAQSEHSDKKEFIVEKQLMSGLLEQLNLVSEESLPTAVKRLQQQFQIELSLDRKKDLSFSAEMTRLLESQEGMLIDSGSDIQLMRVIQAHPDWLLNYHLSDSQNIKKEPVNTLELWMTILFYLSFCFALVLWALPLTRRLSKLNRLASEFGLGNLSKRITPSRFSYINELENSFNQMASQIEELLAENKLLAGSVSHDLRTPLSCLRFGVDAALETTKVEKKDYYLQRMDDDLKRMETMLEVFLDYASLERKRFELNKTRTDIDKLIESCVFAYLPIAKSEQIKIRVEKTTAQDSMSIFLDPNWILRALTNLIANAVNHANEQVVVYYHYDSRHIIISVEDDGAGIPESEVDNIFKAFVKLDKSRSQGNRYGLGLAIVARVISWHKGKVKVDRSTLLGGARFMISLPINSD